MNTSLALPPDAPWTVAPVTARPNEHASLQRSLLAATLLHVALVLSLGTSPGGSLRVGDSVWGALQVTLDGPGPKDSPGRSDQALPYTGPAGRAMRPRWGGEVQQAPALPSPEPGARELGTWNPRTAPGQAVEAHPEPGSAVGPQPSPALTREGPGPSRVPSPSPVVESTPAPPPTPTAARAAMASPEPSTAPRLAPQDKVEAPVLEHNEQTARDISRPVPARSAPDPSLLAPPAPQTETRTDPPRLPPPALPAAQPQTNTLAAPAPTTGEPTSPRALDPSPPAPPAADAPLPAVPVVPQPTPLPRVPDGPVLAGPRSRPDQAPEPPRSVVVPAPDAPASAAFAPAGPAASNNSAAPAETAKPTARDAAAPAAAGDTPAAARQAPAQPGAGAPRAGAQTGTDRATPPGAVTPGAPLNLELPRPRGSVPSAGARGLLNLVPPPPETRSKLAQDIEKSGKADCRKAYGNMGLLAVIPLAADAARADGCKW